MALTGLAPSPADRIAAFMDRETAGRGRAAAGGRADRRARGHGLLPSGDGALRRARTGARRPGSCGLRPRSSPTRGVRCGTPLPRGRDADRDRGGADPDAQFPGGRAGAAVELVSDLAVEPDRDLLPLGDLDEGGLVGVPEGEPAERPGPLDRVPGRHHPQLEAPVIRLRLRERLDSAQDLADVRGQHARQPCRRRRACRRPSRSPSPGGRRGS